MARQEQCAYVSVTAAGSSPELERSGGAMSIATWSHRARRREITDAEALEERSQLRAQPLEMQRDVEDGTAAHVVAVALEAREVLAVRREALAFDAVMKAPLSRVGRHGAWVDLDGESGRRRGGAKKLRRYHSSVALVVVVARVVE